MTAPGQLPEPFTPAESNLRGFQFMPVDVDMLVKSQFATFDPEACWAGVVLWCQAWHQIPAASLPDNDRELASLAGYGRDVDGFMAIKAQAMHKWVLCSDGRWYHPVVADKALAALAHQTKQTDKSKLAAEARRLKVLERKGVPVDDPRNTRGSPVDDPRNTRGLSVAHQQTGTGTGIETDRQSEAVDNSGKVPVTVPVSDRERSVIDPETGEITKVGEPDTENNRPPSFGGGDEGAPRPEPRTAVDQREEFNSPPPAGGAYTTPDRDETSTSGMQRPEQPSPGGVAFNGPRRNQAEVMVLASLVETELHKIGIPDCKRTSSVLLEQLAAGHSPESYVKAALQLNELLQRKPGSVKKHFGWVLGTVAAQGVAAPAAPPAPAKPKRAAAKPAAAPVDPAVVAKAKADLAALTEKMRATAKPLKRAGSVS